MVEPERSAPPGGSSRWLLAHDHGSVGARYLLFAGAMLAFGGLAALLLRAELSAPGQQYMDIERYHDLVDLHGAAMLFGALLPALLGMATWILPWQLGARDMALPRLGNLSFWLLPAALVALVAQLFGHTEQGGQMESLPSVSAGLQSLRVADVPIALVLIGTSVTLAAGNVMATLVRGMMRGRPLVGCAAFSWTWLCAAAVVLLAMGTAVVTALTAGTSAEEPVVWFRRDFWRHAHPLIYVMMLPAFGIVAEVIEAYAGRPLFGRRSVFYAVASLGALSLVVWPRYFVAPPVPVAIELMLMYAAMLMVVPGAVIVCNLLATLVTKRPSAAARAVLRDGAGRPVAPSGRPVAPSPLIVQPSRQTPVLFALAAIVFTTVGGLAGFSLSISALDVQYRGSYFVVAHLHYMLVCGVLFAVYAGLYAWLPVWCGRMYEEPIARVHFWLSLIGANVAFIPHFLLGLAGMPRRVPEYPLMWLDLNWISSTGAYLFGFAQLVVVWVIVKAVGWGRPVHDFHARPRRQP